MSGFDVSNVDVAECQTVDTLLIGSEVSQEQGRDTEPMFRLTLDNTVIRMSLHQAACMHGMIGKTLREYRDSKH